MSSVARNRQIGVTADRPFRLLASINAKSFGDFISSCFFANSVAGFFDHARITFLFKHDLPFKPNIVQMIPNCIAVAVPESAPLPSMDLLNITFEGDRAGPLGAWFQAGLYEQDFVLTDSMTWIPALLGFDYPEYLQIAPNLAPQLHTQLLAAGVDPKRWFCCLHYREPGYKYKPGKPNLRDSDPANYLAVTNYIIEKLGGQVVRLGHPQMTPFPRRSGFIDLSQFDDSEMLQAYAVSRSRFVLAGPSGPTTLATAQGVPLGHTDAVDFWAGVHAHDAIRSVDIITPSGERLNQRAYEESGISKRDLIGRINAGENYRVEKNPPHVLSAMADWMYETTRDVQAWRDPVTRRSRTRPNLLTWPIEPQRRCHYLEV